MIFQLDLFSEASPKGGMGGYIPPIIGGEGDGNSRRGFKDQGPPVLNCFRAHFEGQFSRHRRALKFLCRRQKNVQIRCAEGVNFFV